MKSTHECDIDWPLLPKAATAAHIIAQLRQQSLLSVVQLCDAGCKVPFLEDQCIIKYKSKIVLLGIKFPRTRLWLVPFNNQYMHRQLKVTNPQQTCNNTYINTSQVETIKYIHQCFFSPTKSTILKLIANNQLIGVPGLTKEAVIKYLPPSSATIKGHMN